MGDTYDFFDFAPTSSGKSVPGILNRKRKTQPQNFMAENQENSSLFANESLCNAPLADSFIKRKSPKTTLSSPPKNQSGGLILRTEWKRFRDSDDNKQNETKHTKLIAQKNPSDLWQPFHSKPRKSYQRSQSEVLLSKHSSLSPKMRTILLDWLIEVCEVYRLHRETFYLAADFFDRYMSSTTDIPKTKLQLIGVTCLFISAKIEEIYPPKLQEFAYVTDGACSEEDILAMELVVLKILNWSLSPQTPNAWTKLLLQIDGLELNKFSQSTTQLYSSLIKPAYSGLIHSKAMHLLDLCILDIGSLDYSYSSLAASALYFIQESQLPSELDHEEVSRCINWMAPFAQAIQVSGYPTPKSTSPGTKCDEISNYQCHTVDIKLLELAHRHIELQDQQDEDHMNDSGDFQDMVY